MTRHDTERPRLFRLPVSRRRLGSEIDRELHFHIEGRIDELVASGYSRDAAEREVFERFGDLTSVREECEEIDVMTHRRRELEELRAALARDVRHAMRGLARRPAFSSVVVLTLALGIGATTAIFTLLDAVVLRPLPYPSPERLVVIQHPVPGVGDDHRWGMSQAGYFYFRKHAQSFANLGVFTRGTTNLTMPDGAERTDMASVSASALDVLGARPHLGRLFTDADNRPDAAGVVVLGYHFWQQRFNADPQIVGKSITLASTPYEIVGVMSAAFDLPDYRAQIWMPQRLDPDAPAQNAHYLQAVARLRPGVDIAAAQADAARLTSRLPEEFPLAYSRGFMEESRFTVLLEPLRDFVIGGVRRTLWILLGAVSIVLIIACANVANLFLVRAESRGREVAIRTALGASRSHLAGHYLAESLVLSVLGGIGGAALAYLAMRALLVLNPSSVPRLAELSFGWRPVAVAFVVALGIGGLLALLPLLRLSASGVDVATLREGGRAQTASRRQLTARSTLIAAQMALAVMLLAAAGLMLRTFDRLRSVHPGVDTSNLLTFNVVLPFSRYGGIGLRGTATYNPTFRYYQEMLPRLAALPDVESVAITTALPIQDSGGCAAVYVESQQSANKDAAPCLPAVIASPGYFTTMGITIRGQAPTWSDMESKSGGVVVSRAFAERMWPGEDAIGKRLRPNGFGEPYYHVVGVASDVRAAGLDKPPSEMVYYPMIPIEGAPLWQPPRGASFVIRTRGVDPLALVPTVRRTLSGFDREVPMASIATMQTVVSKSLAKTTFAMILLAIAGGMALILSAVGIYGVISYTVDQRRAEIGVRMALGARRGQVGRMVVTQSLRVAGYGIGVGLAGAIFTTRIMQSLLFGVSPTDPITLVAVTVMLVAIAALASYAPARRATAVDPVEVLRRE
jgi:putative ABC transport system permease protein